MVTDLPLVQAGFFNPIIKSLDSAGVSTSTLLRDAALHRFDISNKENYVPATSMYRFFGEISRREGIDNFFEVFSDHIKAQGMCDWLDVVAHSPDLLSAIKFAIKNQDVVLTHQRLDLQIDGPVCKFSMCYLDQPQYLDQPHRGREYTDYADFCLAYNFFKQADGPDWQPLEIHLQSLEAPDFDNLLPTGAKTKIYLGQPVTSLVFPTAMLTVPLLSDDSFLSTETFDDVPQYLSEIIKKLLSSSSNGQVANLEVMADMLNMSPRTLRRRLLAEDTTFSEIVESWRFKSSINLLGLGNIRIKEIAERLGYANTPNFERAFKRWTGQTPGTYRNILSG